MVNKEGVESGEDVGGHGRRFRTRKGGREESSTARPCGMPNQSGGVRERMGSLSD